MFYGLVCLIMMHYGVALPALLALEHHGLPLNLAGNSLYCHVLEPLRRI